MRHHSNKRKFGRSKNQREALLESLAVNFIVRGKMRTTLAKAKELRPFIEKLITRAKKDTLANRRLVSARLGNKPTETKKLFEKIAVTYKERQGGYTRIVKLNPRKSDGAEMAIIELV